MPEHIQVWSKANGYLRQVWHQVVGSAGRVFADKPARMRSNRVEVAQHGDPPSWLRLEYRLQHVFNDELRMPVGAGVTARKVLGDRHHCGVTVNSSAAGEDERGRGW